MTLALVSIRTDPEKTVAPIRVFVARTQWTPDDPLAIVGHPPLFRPGTPDTPVMISVTFTWHKRRAELLAEEWRDHYRSVHNRRPGLRWWCRR
jgi:hypothetical protein